MKKSFPLIAILPLVFTACENKSESQTGASPEATTSAPAGQTASPFNSALTNVVSNLETDGSHFSITHVDEDLMQLAEAVDAILDIAKETSNDIPPNLSVVELIKDLGLSGIDAMGRSSRWSDSAWHNRSFIQTNGDRGGLLSVMGDEGSEWRAGEFAPQDADMVVEFELNLRRLHETMKTVSASFGEEAGQGFDQAMKERIAGGALTMGDVFGKTDLRTTLVVSLDREKRWNVSEKIRLPVMHAAMRIERGMWLWEQFGKQLESEFKVSERDGLKIVEVPEEMRTPMGMVRPLIVLDESEDLIWVSLTEDYLDKCRSSATSVTGSEDFRAATAGFPETGNGLFYVSADFCEELVQQVEKALENLPENGEETWAFTAVSALLDFPSEGGAPEHGYAWCLSNTATGILSVGNAPFPDKGYGFMSGIAPIAAISGFTAPMVVRQRGKANQVEAMSNMRQLFLILFEYETDMGEFPKQLGELVDADLIDEATLSRINSHRVDGETKPFVYIPGHSTAENPSTIIMHTSASTDGKRACLRVDGSMATLREDEFLEQMKEQQTKE